MHYEIQCVLCISLPVYMQTQPRAEKTSARSQWFISYLSRGGSKHQLPLSIIRVNKFPPQPTTNIIIPLANPLKLLVFSSHSRRLIRHKEPLHRIKQWIALTKLSLLSSPLRERVCTMTNNTTSPRWWCCYVSPPRNAKRVGEWSANFVCVYNARERERE